MCFANTSEPPELEAYYEEDGSINEQIELVYIPDGIHNHIDNPVLYDNLEDGILAFIYENGQGLHIVYTSFEAELMCGEYCDYCNTIHID